MGHEDVIQTRGLDGVELDINQARAVSERTRALDLDEETLRRAVADVGPLIADIRDCLGR